MLPTRGRGRSLVWFITPSPPAARRPDAEIEKGRAISAAFIYFRKSPPARARRNSSAGGAQIVGRRLARAAIRYDFVADLLAFTQRAKSGALYGADVHEHVVATVIRLNEAEALGRVKPLHGSHAHGVVPSQIDIVEAHFRWAGEIEFLEGSSASKPAVPVDSLCSPAENPYSYIIPK